MCTREETPGQNPNSLEGSKSHLTWEGLCISQEKLDLSGLRWFACCHRNTTLGSVSKPAKMWTT